MRQRTVTTLFAMIMPFLPLGCGSSGDAIRPTPVLTPSPASSCSAAPVSGMPPLKVELVAQGFELPLDLETPGDHSRLFVVEQLGRIRIIREGTVVGTPFLDISDRVSRRGGEHGLLGLAFHPRFAENGRFFVSYTDHNLDTNIAEFRATGDAAEPNSERTLDRKSVV